MAHTTNFFSLKLFLRLGLLGSALGLDPLGETDDTSDEEDEEVEGEEEDYDSPLASVSYFDYDYDDVSEEDFNNAEEAAVTTTPRPTTIPSSVSTTTTIPNIGNTDVVLEEFTAEEQCCCLPISSCPSVSANLMVEVEETVNTSSTTTPSPSRVIFRSGLGAVGGCNEGEVRCCEGCNEVPLGREISCGREGEGEAELAPWACVLLTRDNGFVGTCVILGPSTVATAAHKLNKILLPSQLKVRVGDFDLRGFNQPEQSKHTEFVVDDIVRHPEFNPKRLSHDLALVFLENDMEMQESNVGSICLPTFREEFTSGENIECRVNGWGTHSTNGALMPVMGSHKVRQSSQSSGQPALFQTVYSASTGRSAAAESARPPSFSPASADLGVDFTRTSASDRELTIVDFSLFHD